MIGTEWDLVKVSSPPAGWFALEDSTWDALISAMAGEENLLRRLHQSKAFFDGDQGVIDGFIDEHLAAADVPPRPRGYEWFLRPPPRPSSLQSLHEDLNEFIRQHSPQASHPQELCALVKAFLHRLYSRQDNG
jgi:Family of unknown function (DUF5956)